MNQPLAEFTNQRRSYELYRIILDYEALQDGFLDRIDDLNTTLEQIDMAGGFAKGNVQKLLTKNPGKSRDTHVAAGKRTFGWESLGKMLQGTGLALVLVVDDDRFAPIKEQLMQRRSRKPQPKQLSIEVLNEFKSGLFRKNGALGGKARLTKLSKRQRVMIAKAGAAARWRNLRPRRSSAAS